MSDINLGYRILILKILEIFSDRRLPSQIYCHLYEKCKITKFQFSRIMLSEGALSFKFEKIRGPNIH